MKGLYKSALIAAICALPLVANAGLAGLWEFEDAGNLLHATVGSDLALTGTDTAVAGSGGPDAGASSMDLGDFYTVTNPIGVNGGGATKTNQYTILMDINDTSSGYNALLDMSLEGDGDLFINGDGGIGISGVYSGVVNDGRWHRLVMVYNLGSADPLTTYIDGAFNHAISSGDISGGGVVDDRFGLQTTFTAFSDNGGGEEFTTSISNLALFDGALDANQVAALGGAGRIIIPEPGTLGLVALLALALSALGRRRNRG